MTNEITIEVKFEYFTGIDVCGHLYTILNLFRRKINILENTYTQISNFTNLGIFFTLI